MRLLPALRTTAVVLSTALAACDLPTDPVPTNPYDPAFDGPRRATSPDRVVLAAATPTSVTVAWTDRSSFESGFRVERAVLRTDASPQYETVAFLPADAESYTDGPLPDTAPRLYRVTALAALEGAPSAPVGVRYPAESLVLDALREAAPDVREVTLSADGETLYASTFSDVWVVDTRSGEVRRVPGVNRVAGLLADGRVALVVGQAGPPPAGSATIRTVVGTTPIGEATFDGVGTGSCSVVQGYTLRVSADGQTVVGACGPVPAFGSTLAVWAAGGGAPLRTVPLDREADIEVAPDGSRAFVQTRNALPATLSAYDTATGARLWTRSDAGQSRIVVSPDGTRLLDVSPAGARVLDAATGVVRAGPVPTGTARPLTFSADGQQVAYEARSGETVVARTADLVPTIRLDRAFASAFRLLGGGRAVAVRAEYEVVRWDFSRPWEAAP